MSNSDQLANDPGRRQWKMIHLLYLYGGDSGLSFSQLWNAGVDCKADGTDPVVNAGVAAAKNGNLELTQAATKILEVCTALRLSVLRACLS